jgi:hypothetical protein
MRATCLACLILLVFIALTSVDKQSKSRSTSLCSSVQPAVSSSSPPAAVLVFLFFVVVVSAATLSETQHGTARVTQSLSPTFSKNSQNSCRRSPGSFHSSQTASELENVYRSVRRWCHVTAITSHRSCCRSTQPTADCYQPNQMCALHNISRYLIRQSKRICFQERHQPQAKSPLPRLRNTCEPIPHRVNSK